MSLVAEMLKSVSCYRNGEISLNQFENWFRDNSYGMFGESRKVRQMCLAIDAAFSELRYGALSAELFDEELANAIRPFEQAGSMALATASTMYIPNLDSNTIGQSAIGVTVLLRNHLHTPFPASFLDTKAAATSLQSFCSLSVLVA